MASHVRQDNRADVTRGFRLDFPPANSTEVAMQSQCWICGRQDDGLALIDGSAVATSQIQEQGPRLLTAVREIRDQLGGDLGPLLPSWVQPLLRESHRPLLLRVPGGERQPQESPATASRHHLHEVPMRL